MRTIVEVVEGKIKKIMCIRCRRMCDGVPAVGYADPVFTVWCPCCKRDCVYDFVNVPTTSGRVELWTQLLGVD